MTNKEVIMLKQEISITEMIHYLAGHAPADVTDRIEDLLKTDPDFQDEMDDWRMYMSTFSSDEEAIDSLEGLRQAWNETELVDPGSRKEEEEAVDSSEEIPKIRLFDAPSVSHPLKKTRVWRGALAMAAVIAVLLMLVPVMDPGGVETVDYMAFAGGEVSSGIEDLIGVTQGGEEEFDRQLRQHRDAKQYTSALIAIDSMIGAQPQSNKYRKLKGLILAESGNMQEAIRELNALRNDQGISADDYCKVNWQLAMLYFQNDDKVLFNEVVSQWNDPNAQVPCSSLSEKKNAKLMNMLQEIR